MVEPYPRGDARYASPVHRLVPLIGRDQEVALLQAVLATERLVTLTGPGGCGKSRLALAAAEVFADAQALSLTVLQATDDTTVANIWQMLAERLPGERVPETATGRPNTSDPFQRICTIGATGGTATQWLVVFDDVDRLLADLAPQIEVILAACPNVRVLATSREALDCAGEYVWPVLPLATPDAGITDPTAILGTGAVRCFLHHAGNLLPPTSLDAGTVRKIAELCRQLDGLPVALELAAARLNMLTLHQLLELSEEGNAILTGGRRTGQRRHAAIDATIAWSYAQLDLADQRRFMQLAAFPGVFTLAEAAARCGGDPLVAMDALARLCARSLIAVTTNGDQHAYRLLNTFRRFALKRRSAPTGAPDGDQIAPPTPPAMPNRDPSTAPSPHTARRSRSSPPAPQNDVGLRITSFGKAEVLSGGVPLGMQQRFYAKARELFFYLLCQSSRDPHAASSGGVSKAQIGLDLWPEASAESLRDNLHSALYCLRQALGPETWIVFKDQRYHVLPPQPIWFDLDVFRRYLQRAYRYRSEEPERAIQALEAAVQIYQGDFLPDFVANSWTDDLREQTRRQCCEALETLGQLALERAAPRKALTYYQRIIAIDRFAESGHRGVIAAYLDLRDHGQALRHYHHWRHLLAEELGAVPAAATSALVAAYME